MVEPCCVRIELREEGLANPVGIPSLQEAQHEDLLTRDLLHAQLLYRGQRREEIAREYFDVYYRSDERVPRFWRLPDSQVVHCRDMYTEEELKTSPTYNEMLPRGGFQNSLNVRLDGAYGTRITWGIGDPFDGSDWSSAQIDTIGQGCGQVGGQVRAKVNEIGLGKPASERRAFKLAYPIWTQSAHLHTGPRRVICRIERPDTRQHLTACTEPTKNCLHQRERPHTFGQAVIKWTAAGECSIIECGRRPGQKHFCALSDGSRFGQRIPDWQHRATEPLSAESNRRNLTAGATA